MPRPRTASTAAGGARAKAKENKTLSKIQEIEQRRAARRAKAADKKKGADRDLRQNNLAGGDVEFMRMIGKFRKQLGPALSSSRAAVDAARQQRERCGGVWPGQWQRPRWGSTRGWWQQQRRHAAGRGAGERQRCGCSCA